MTVTFGPDHIVFVSYEFPWSGLHPHGVLPAARVRDVSTAFQPEIRTVSGETLFLSADDAPGLVSFCLRHGIAEVARYDVWGDLLEPFLDTEFGVEDQEACVSRLVAAGLARGEVSSIRERFAPLMESYNFDSMLWEWTHLGLFDLLRALNGTLVDPVLPARLGDLSEVYRWAMGIADYGRAKAS
ncbi:hypothetical protein [Lentzea sp. NPDC003310]|uniref:hypothetical protein n=1 Tax=Lentzea sp. NPDC003310 TaxID=3154447 RepID=UPI0033A012B7